MVLADGIAKDMKKLTNKQIAIVVGHEVGGGSKGEREYQCKVASHMEDLLEDLGASVYVHTHTIKAYDVRQRIMRREVLTNLPNSDCTIELHYNSFDLESANGHEFFYRGAQGLAECFRDEWQAAFPNSVARRSNGIEKRTRGDGAGFLKHSPSWACLVEPFFESNDDEWDFFKDKHLEVAEVYVRAIARFLTKSN